MCEDDVPPFVIVQGDRARVRVLNKVGLRRRGIPEPEIETLERAFRAIVFGKKSPTPTAADSPMVRKLKEALAGR
jgi:acyl-[acyl carrier protein]--UDP-N-acetylglucosamine O-acyltransferase